MRWSSDGLSKRCLLSGFGNASRVISSDSSFSSAIGHLSVMPPDELARLFGQGSQTQVSAKWLIAKDVWCLGLGIAFMLTGRTPTVTHESRKVALLGLQDAGSRAFLHSLLEVDADKRLTTDQLFRHDWMTRVIPSETADKSSSN